MDQEKIKRYKDWDLHSIADAYGFSFTTVGGKLRGLCLFHGDTNTPNLFLYPDDTFFCYGCKRGWSKSQFVAYAENVPRKMVDRIWERSTELTEVMDLKLKQRQTNYRDSLLLLWAKILYNKQQAPGFNTMVARDIDEEIASREFVDLAAYSRIVKRIEEMK